MSAGKGLPAALEQARKARDADVADLADELRIPSVSTLPEHRDDCRRAAEWLADRLGAIGFATQVLDVVPDGNPVLRADWTERPGAPLLTVYGHYDVQPADPLADWETGPFEPVLSGQYLRGRGATDNKGGHMAAIAAARHWMAAGGPPVNVRFLIEGEEEVGGPSLPAYLRSAARELATDVVVLWDGGFTADDRPSLTAALRGVLFVEIEITGAAQDLHSGGFGGIAPNACAELARVLNGLKDSGGRVTVPGFYDDVAVPDPAERSRWHVAPDFAERMKEIMGVSELVGEEGHGPAERLWSRPTLEVNGLSGGFTGEGSKTIVPSRATAKISLRLVPDQRPDKIAAALALHAAALAGPGVQVAVREVAASPPVYLGHDHSGARAMTRALTEAFGTEAVVVRSGGSIPVAAAFRDAIGAPMVISGIGHPAAGAHGPNERLSLAHFHRGIEAMIRLMHHLEPGDA